MKKISTRTISLILCLAMLVGYIVLPDVPAANAETAATNPNLVENGTFETQLADGTIQANKEGWGYMSGDASVVAEEGNENNYVARITDNKSTGGKYIYYGVDVEPGAIYTFKIDYKATYTAASPAIYLRRDAYNGTNLHTKSGLTSDTWKTYETTLEIPADVTKLFIIAASSTAAVGTVYIDNVSVIKGVVTDGGEDDEPEQDVTIPEANLIANGGFEKQSDGSTIASTDGWGYLPSSKIWSVIEDPDKAGNFVLKLADNDANSGGSIYYETKPGMGFYTLKFDYKAENAMDILVRVGSNTSSGEQIARFAPAPTEGAWKTFEGTVEVPTEDASVYIVLNSSKAAQNVAYLDNISFEIAENDDGNEGGEITEPEYEIVIPEENLLKNPLFELTTSLYNTPLNATTAPSGWTVEITGAGVQLFKSNVKLAYKGDWSILAVDNSVNGSFKMSTKVENIQPGVEYTFAYARMGEGRPVVAVRYYDAKGKMLGEYSKNIAGDSEWKWTTQKGVAPEGASYAIVSVESTASLKCNINLDEITFYVTADTSRTNLLTNGSFEEYPDSWQDVLVGKETAPTTKGWKFGGTGGVSLIPAETELDKEAVGNYMIQIVDESSTGSGNIYYDMDIEPGKTYAFSAMVKGEYTAGSPQLRISFYQDENCQVEAMIKTTNYRAATLACGADYWSRGCVTATAPENAIRMRLYVLSTSSTVGWMNIGNFTVVSDMPNKFDNLDFEDLDESDAVEGWYAYENGVISANKKNVFAGKVSLQIKDNSEAVQQGAIGQLTDLSGYQIGKYAATDLTFSLAARVRDAKNVKAQLAIIYYDNGFKEIKRDSLISAGTGKWQFLVVNSKMPTNAAYARIALTVGDNAGATGTVYLDDVTLCAEYGQYIDEAYDWNIKYTEGNRLYFTEDELEVIREFAKDDTINAFGISGANAYRTLIKRADGYIAEEFFRTSWTPSPDNDRVTLYVVNMDHIQDISADPLLADVPGGRNWPYLENIAAQLHTRFETVALAYAITGDTKYADRAIGWALDLCEWEYWTETKYVWPSSLNTTMDTPRLVMGMSKIYDMCYDRMTEAQRTLIRENIIHKCLKPIYLDLTGPDRLVFTNKYMVRCGGLLIGTLAVINEDNKAELGKYLDRAYSFAKTFLDQRLATADNEGYSYTSGPLEELVMGMDAATRVTGRESLLTHPFITDVLIDWVCDFLAPGSSEFPVYSDSYASGFFESTMLLLNKTTGNGKAGYYLQQTGLDSDPFKVLLYCNYEPVVTEPTENDYVVFAERVGYGGLRTGWDEGDMMFYIIGNTSNTSHNQYEQLSFQITTNGLWPATDPGYSNLTEGFDEQEGHNTLIVDGVGQSVKGTGSLETVVDAQLYGQLSGSAAGAYGEGVLTQFDRHAIMINHGDRPYYIVIDEVASDDAHVYDFNLNTGGWTDITVDGKAMAEGINKGNKVAIYGNNGYFFAEFVSKTKLNIEAKMYEDGGPVLQADNGSQKSQQFMTIMTKPYGIKLDDSCSFLPLLNTPELVSYKTSSHDATIVKGVKAQGTPLYFFRGHKEGDWIELPFTAPETGTFELILQTAKSYNYGIYKIYIDGEYMATYDGYDPMVFVYNLSLGKHEITAGDHMLRLELIGANAKTVDKLISVASITYGTEQTMPEHPIYTQEVYDTDKVLGARIFHTVNNSDIILLNRTTGKITAGGVTGNGEQSAIIGLMEDGYMEGYTLVAGTSLSFDGKTLVKASGAVTVSADFRGKAKYAVTTEKDQSISLYAPYEILGATVDGKSVKYSVDGNLAKVSVPAGTHTVELKVKNAVEYLWGDEAGSGKALYDENGEITYKYWNGEDRTEYLFEDGQVKINAYFDTKTKLLVREELLEDDSWQVTTYDLIGNVSTIEIQHINGNVTLIKYQTDGSVATTVTDSKGNNLEMIMEYKDGSKTVAQYLDDRTVTTKYGTNGNVLAVTTMHNDGRRVEETYDENGKLLSKITRAKGGNREEVVYNADGSVVTTVYTANKLTSVQTVNADGTSVLEEHLEDGSVRVTKYDKDGKVLEVTINGQLIEEETNNLRIIIVIAAVAVVGAAALVIILVKIKKRNGKKDAE